MIRRATSPDLPALAEVIRAAYAPFAAAGLNLPPVDQGLDEDLAHHNIWVVEVASRVLGGVVADTRRHRALLMNLAVRPDGAGHGLGRALIDTAMAAARSRGATRMALAIHRDMTTARYFYTGLGWFETGQEDLKVYMQINLKGDSA